MPIAFFTRTQTGALDQPHEQRRDRRAAGAHRHARLGRVERRRRSRSPLAAMVVLEWRLTLLALVAAAALHRPGQARRAGACRRITREGMDLNAAMNTTMTERFNVSGALLVKLFGRHDARGRASSRDKAGPGARHRRDAARCTAGRSSSALGLVGAVGTAVVYWLGGQLGDPAARSSSGTLVALAAYVTQIYPPLTALTNARVDLMTAFVSFDRVFEVLDAPRADRRPARRRRPASTRRSHRARRRVVPLPARRRRCRSPRSRPTAHGRVERRAVGLGAPGRVVHRRAGPAGRARRSVGRGQDHAVAARAPPLRRDRAAPSASTATTCATSPRPACASAIGVVTQDPHLFHDTDRRQPALRPARRHRRRAGRRVPGGADPRRHRGAARRLRHGRRRARLPRCRAARSSGWPSPACC